MTEQEWASRFAAELTRLGMQATHDQLTTLARNLWETFGAVAPERAARGEFDLWPAATDDGRQKLPCPP